MAAHLHLAIGIGDRAVLFRPGRGRQHDVGIDRGLGEEQVLHDEMFEMGQCLARVIEIRIRHRGIFTHDVHALDHVSVDRVHDLDNRETFLRIELGAPGSLNAGADLRIFDRFVIREEHRNKAGVRGALHIVLPA